MLYKPKENIDAFDMITKYRKELREIVRTERSMNQDHIKNILNYERKNLENKLDKIKYEIK